MIGSAFTVLNPPTNWCWDRFWASRRRIRGSKIDSGICGAAVREEDTIIVDDVNSDPRYLACSLETKSEIVVPIFKNGKVVGELDIDSHTPAAFTEVGQTLSRRSVRDTGGGILDLSKIGFTKRSLGVDMSVSSVGRSPAWYEPD